MLPLVYDFGQISGETEQKYINEIVLHSVSYNSINLLQIIKGSRDGGVKKVREQA